MPRPKIERNLASAQQKLLQAHHLGASAFRPFAKGILEDLCRVHGLTTEGTKLNIVDRLFRFRAQQTAEVGQKRPAFEQIPIQAAKRPRRASPSRGAPSPPVRLCDDELSRQMDVDDDNRASASRRTSVDGLEDPPSPSAHSCDCTPSEIIDVATDLPFEDTSAANGIRIAPPSEAFDVVAALPFREASERNGFRDDHADRRGHAVPLSDDENEQMTDDLRIAYRLPKAKLIPATQAIPVKLFANSKAPSATRGTEIRRLADGTLDLKELALQLSVDRVRAVDPIKRVPYIERKDGILQPLEIKHIVAEGFLRVINVQTTVPPSRPRSVFMFPGLRGI